MRRLFAILSFVCLVIPAVGQEETRVVDSMTSILSQQQGREKVETMIEISKAFFDFSFDDCIDWSEKAIKEAEKMKDNQLTAIAYGEQGIHYLNHYEFDLSKSSFNSALTFLADGNDSTLLKDVLNYLGRVELLMGDMELAQSTFERDLEISKRLGHEMNCADVTNNLAYIYYYRDDFDRAMELFQDARRRYVRLEDTLSAAQCDNNISNIYVEKQQYDEARALLLKAIPVFVQYEDEASLAHAYQNMGTVYATGHINLDSALLYLHKSIECAGNVGDEITLAEDEIELANVMKLLGKDDEAMGLYQSAMKTSETIGYVNGILEAYKQLGVHHYEAQDFSISAEYFRKCLDLANEKGNRLCANTVRPYLIADLARLGRFEEMNKEMSILQAEYALALAESEASDQELDMLQDEAANLLSQHDSLNQQIEALQSQRNHYRLAFFGLLALVVAVIAFWVLRRILLYNRNRTK